MMYQVQTATPDYIVKSVRCCFENMFLFLMASYFQVKERTYTLRKLHAWKVREKSKQFRQTAHVICYEAITFVDHLLITKHFPKGVSAPVPNPCF